MIPQYHEAQRPSLFGASRDITKPLFLIYNFAKEWEEERRKDGSSFATGRASIEEALC